MQKQNNSRNSFTFYSFFSACEHFRCKHRFYMWNKMWNKRKGMLTHYSGEEVLLRQPPLVSVVLVVGHVVVHDLIVGVKQNVAGCTRHRVLQVIH